MWDGQCPQDPTDITCGSPATLKVFPSQRSSFTGIRVLRSVLLFPALIYFMRLRALPRCPILLYPSTPSAIPPDAPMYTPLEGLRSLRASQGSPSLSEPPLPSTPSIVTLAPGPPLPTQIFPEAFLPATPLPVVCPTILPDASAPRLRHLKTKVRAEGGGTGILTTILMG